MQILDKAIFSYQPEPINDDIKFNTKFYDKRMKVFFDVFNHFFNQFTKMVGYIYKLQHKITKKVFIGGYDTKVDISDILRNEKVVGHKQDEFDFMVIDTYYSKSHIDFMFRIDYYKLLYNSIDNGFNTDYCLQESSILFAPRMHTRTRTNLQKTLFLKINRYLVEHKLQDDTDYENIYGFVYQIKNINDGKRYIACAHTSTLKTAILKLYDSVSNIAAKYNKILQVLTEEPYYNFVYSILVIKTTDDTTINIQDATDKLISKFDTINNGYNVDIGSSKKKNSHLII
jgi:hypothetical protein